MTFKEQMNYQAYEHQYKEDDILLLKNQEELNKIDKMLINTDSPDAFVNSNWYLTKEKIELLSNKHLKVLNCISWHMGIPFYNLQTIEKVSSIIYVGEFYLKKEKE